MGAGTQSTAATSGMEVGTGRAIATGAASVDPSVEPLRVLLAERRATAHSDLSRRLRSLGRRGAGAVDERAAHRLRGFLCPDVV